MDWARLPKIEAISVGVCHTGAAVGLNWLLSTPCAAQTD